MASDGLLASTKSATRFGKSGRRSLAAADAPGCSQHLGAVALNYGNTGLCPIAAARQQCRTWQPVRSTY
jgi:hypothetical protein